VLLLKVHLIWKRKITLSTTVYLLLRYLGLVSGTARFLGGISIPWSNKTALVLNVICALTQTSVIFLIQGILATRVYCLLGKPKRLMFFLVAGFSASQAGNLLAWVVSLVFVPKNIETVDVLRFRISVSASSSNVAWVSPLVTSLELAYELFLSGLALHYAWNELPRKFWLSRSAPAKTIVEVVVHGNLIYFAISFFVLVFSAGTSVPAANNSVPYWCTFNILLFAWICMAGPWMMLSVQKKSEDGLFVWHPSQQSMELSRMRFADVPMQRMEIARRENVQDNKVHRIA